MRWSLYLGTAALIAALVPTDSPTRTLSFDSPIDAVSFAVETEDTEVSVRGLLANGSWTDWETLVVETEFDPLLRETALTLFPEKVRQIEVRSTETALAHPLRVNNAPVSWEVAAISAVSRPRILTRAQWGADESLLVAGTDTSRSDAEPETNVQESGDNGDAAPVSKRIQDCLDAQQAYPSEFKVKRTVTQDSAGKTFRWPQQYSPKVNLLVVHHTALKVGDDTRSGVERMRALYQYHAQSRGWGDVGYNFLIDEQGQIYEGRAGGNYVVGGHAYCNNTGTIGVSLMGNFDVEKPSQTQMQSLQWLLADLSKRYGIDPSRSVQFHGKKLNPIVGHRDLLSTDCPGYYAYAVMGQVRSNVVAGNIGGAIRFPTIAKNGYQDRTTQRLHSRQAALPTQQSQAVSALSPVGSTTINAQPGGTHVFLMHFNAGNSGMNRRTRIADIQRSNDRMGVWQEIGGRDVRVRDELILPDSVRAGQSATLRLKVQLPTTGESHTLNVGDVTYTFTTKGRRARTPVATPLRVDTSATRRISTAIGMIARSSASSTASVSSVRSTQSVSTISGDNGPQIRIRLTKRETGATSCQEYNLTVISRMYRGTVRCQIVDGLAALINEVPLEAYLWGLAEEPDTEPYEKQRAFAIAARSYAAHYLDYRNRKFPGKPYDGDDSPARFQAYNGIAFEQNNPAWVRSVSATAHLVLIGGDDIVKAAYYSSNDGRTRSPEENGWKNYPHATFFASKPDPWCQGMEMRGHGVGMSGCGAKGQALEGKTAEEILMYYYAGADITPLR